MAPTPVITTDECRILRALVDRDAGVPERTFGSLVGRLHISPRELADLLGALRAHAPPLVDLVLDEECLMQAWFATEQGRLAFTAHCEAVDR